MNDYILYTLEKLSSLRREWSWSKEINKTKPPTIFDQFNANLSKEKESKSSRERQLTTHH